MSEFVIPIGVEELREELARIDREMAESDRRFRKILEQHQAKARADEKMREHRERQRLKVLNDLQNAADDQQAMIRRIARRSKSSMTLDALRQAARDQAEANDAFVREWQKRRQGDE
jgi:hypothetical protein